MRQSETDIEEFEYSNPYEVPNEHSLFEWTKSGSPRTSRATWKKLLNQLGCALIVLLCAVVISGAFFVDRTPPEPQPVAIPTKDYTVIKNRKWSEMLERVQNGKRPIFDGSQSAESRRVLRHTPVR